MANPDAQLIGVNSAGGNVTTVAGNSAGITKFAVFLKAFSNTAFDAMAPTVTDSQGNKYTQVVPLTYDTSGSDAITVFVCERGVGAASHTATMSFGIAPFMATAVLIGITGADDHALDVVPPAISGGTSYNGANPCNIATGLLSQVPSLVLSVCCYDDGGDANVVWTSSNMTLLESDQGGTAPPNPVSGAIGKLLVTASTASVIASLSPGALATVLHNASIAAITLRAPLAGFASSVSPGIR